MTLIQHLPNLVPAIAYWWSPGHLLNHVSMSAGVDIFFCISGFVVSRILRRRLHGLPLAAAIVEVRRFWTARAFRLWPSAWLWLITAYFVSAYFNKSGVMAPADNLHMILPGLGMYSNYYILEGAYHNQRDAMMVQYWSLSMEEQFYFILPLLLVLVPGGVLPVLFFYVGVRWSAYQDFWANIYLRPGCLVAGVLLSYMEGGTTWRRLQTIRPTGLAVGALCAALCCCAALSSAIGPFATLFYIPIYRFFPALTTLSCFLLILVAAQAPARTAATPIEKILVFLGGRSYVIYIVHMVVYPLSREIMFRLNTNWIGSPRELGCRIGLAVILLIVCVELTARFVEQPLRQYGRRLTAAKQGERPTLIETDFHTTKQ